jgi:hypothetical protein
MRHGWRWVVDVHEGGGCRYIVESDSALLESEALM